MPKKPVDTTIGQLFQVRDLTAGVNLRPTPTNILPNQARRLLNTLISNPGELGVCPGFLTFSTSSLGSRRAQGGERIYLAGSTFTLAADNGNVYKPSDAGVWGSAVLTGLNTTNPVDFVYDRDIVAVFDGANVPKKSVNGTTWTQLGISPPAAAPTLATPAGGALVAGQIYEIAYAYYDNTVGLNQTGNISAKAQATPAGANLTIRVTVVASGDAQVNRIKIYARNVTAGETVLRLTENIANASTTHDITVSDWDGQEEASTDHDVAVALSFGVVWKNRWWARDAVVKNRLRFTQIFQPQSWPATFFVDIPFERGEDITLSIALGDVLVVFGYTKFYLIIGQTSLDFEVRPALGAQTGAFGFKAGDVVESGIVHAAAPGAYLFNGSSDELLTYPVDPAWQAFVDATSAANLALLPVVYHKLVKELRIGVGYVYPTGASGEWILDLNRTNAPANDGKSTGPAWFSTDRPIGGYIQWDGNEATTGNQGRLFSWSPAVVKLFEERVGVTADGASMTMEYDGYMLPFGLLTARIIETYIEYQPATGTLSAALKVDGRTLSTQAFPLGVSASRYGTAKYHVDVYGSIASRTALPITWPIEAEGRSVQFLVKYVGRGTFKLYTYGHNTFSEGIPRGI